MADGFHLSVLTPERAVLDQEVFSIVAPGTLGYLGVLRNHAPLITTLVPGKLTVKDLSHKAHVYAVGGGFMEVARNKVTILADTLESADEIDLKQAMESRDWAQRRLTQSMPPTDKEEAAAALARALNRIRIKRDPGPSV